MKRTNALRLKIILLLGGFIIAKEVVEKGKKELNSVSILYKDNEKFEEISKRAEKIWEDNGNWILPTNKKLWRSVLISLIKIIQ